jgi:hypothetical protein
MQKNPRARERRHERGQTMIFVAISIVSLLALAALAIDIVTLYVARSEIQRAADAAALAGAKAIADSGFTTLPASDGNYATAQTLAQTMATASINAMVVTPAINLVGGQLPVLVGPPSFSFTTNPGSYQVTVRLKSATLPTFFSKIWSRSAAFVTASATAEAYNPANLATFTPIAPLSLKPWLVANSDPITGTTFVNVGTGAVEPGVTGEQLNLIADCKNGKPDCQLRNGHNPPKANLPDEVDYVPLQVSSPPSPKNVCPGTGPNCAAGPTDYEQSIECADTTAYVTPTCGGGATNAVWSDTFNPRGLAGLSASGTECLIHAAGPGPWDGGSNFQDILDKSPWPPNPMKIKAGGGLQSGNFVTTSSSIVTIPIIDVSSPLPSSPGAVTVVGFMQVFINQINPNPGPPPPGDINIYVLNVSGCSNSDNGANPVVGGSGSSPIPVRLITSP